MATFCVPGTSCWHGRDNEGLMEVCLVAVKRQPTMTESRSGRNVYGVVPGQVRLCLTSCGKTGQKFGVAPATIP